MRPHNLAEQIPIPNPTEYFAERRMEHPDNELIARNNAILLYMEVYNVTQRIQEFCKSFFVRGQTGPYDTREYLLDSGASFHLIAWKYLRYEEKKTYRKAEQSITMTTANGNVTAIYIVTIYVQTIDKHVDAYLLDDVVPVLSMGLLCKEHLLKFIWDGHQSNAPYLLHPDGKQTPCDVSQNCPSVLRCQTSARPVEDFSESIDPPVYATTEPVVTDESPAPSPRLVDTGSSASTSTQAFGSKEPVRNLAVGSDALPRHDAATGSSAPPSPALSASQEQNADNTPLSAPPKKEQTPKPKYKARKKAKTHHGPKLNTHGEHNLFTHFPKCDTCPVCQEAKPRHTYMKKSTGEPDPDGLPIPKAWGDAVTADHKILNEDEGGNERFSTKQFCELLARNIQDDLSKKVFGHTMLHISPFIPL